MRYGPVAAIGVLCAIGLVVPAEAARMCAARKITATGAPSNLAFFARARAKTAWTVKVGRDPRLGAPYAQWLKSQERRVVCRKVDTQAICIAAALPCRTVGPVQAVAPTKPSPSLRPL